MKSSTDTERASKKSAADPESWLDEHGDLLYKFALLRVGDQNIAEDLVQETLVNAFKSYQNFRQEASVRTWLFQILKNEINSHFRRLARAKKIGIDEKSEPFEMGQLLHPEINDQQFNTGIEKEEFWAIVQQCFEKIPSHLLETFLFRLSNPEEKVDFLCNELGINSSNFSVRLFRTRLMLRKCLETNWLRNE